MRHWLMKSEPDAFSIQDLAARPKRTESWDGVRNYQARNYLREMKKGDQAFFYHSSCEEPGVYGIVEIAREAYPDASAFDRKSDYHDPKSKRDAPRWFAVDVKLVQKLRAPVALSRIKATPALSKMPLVQSGSRLSVMPVSHKEWQVIIKLSEEITR